VLFNKLILFHLLYLHLFIALFINPQLLTQNLIGPVHIRTGEAGCNAAARIDSYKPIVIPTFQIARHPISPLLHVHAPELALPRKIFHLDSLYLRKIKGFAVAEGKEVAFDLY
jgi:hypothetical protein